MSAANLGKRSRSYIGVKIAVFLSIYSQCGVLAFWAARHLPCVLIITVNLWCIMNHYWDDKEVGVAHKNHPKTNLNFPDDDGVVLVRYN